MKDKENIQIISFIKFGQFEHMNDLLKNGTLYFNPISYFQKIESKDGRADSYEGTTRIRNYHEYDNVKTTITFPETGKTLEVNPIKLHLREFLDELQGNIYSMYAVKTPDVFEKNYKINNKLKEFGSHLVMIKNPKEFIDRIVNKLKLKSIDFKAKLVQYYEKDKFNGELDFFMKSKDFEYQKEFRFFLYKNSLKPFSLSIGSIEDIAEIFPSEGINTFEINF